MAKATEEQMISAFYAAFYDRAPELDGLNYWKEKANGVNDKDTFFDLAEQFAAHPAFFGTYQGMTDQQFIEAIYVNVSGYEGDASGVSYWVNELANESSRSDVVAEMVYGFLNAELTAENFPDLTADELALAQDRQDAVTNKADIGLFYVAALGTATNFDPDTDQTNPVDVVNDPAWSAAKAAIDGVDNTDESVQEAKDAILGIVEEGNSYELTTGIDTIVGTGLNDTIEASLSTDTGANITSTLQSSDTIDGGAGDDVLNVTIENNNINSGNYEHDVALDMQNVETLKVDNLDFYHGSSNVDFLLDRVEGLETIEVGGFGGEDAFWLTPNIVDLDLKDAIDTNVVIDYRNGVLAGDDDSMNISVEGSFAEVFVGEYRDADEDLENVNVDFIGNSSIIYGSYNSLRLYAEGLENVTVTDDGAMTALEAWNELDIMGADETLKTVDASAATGNLSMDMGTEATDIDSELVVTGSEGMNDIDITVRSDNDGQSKTVTVNTGSSNDYINIDTYSSDDFATLTTNVNTGAGDDTTVLSVSSSDVDTVNVNYAGGTGNDRVEFYSNNSDVEHVNITADGGEDEDTIALRQQAAEEFAAIMADPVATEGNIALSNFETLAIVDSVDGANIDISGFGTSNLSLEAGSNDDDSTFSGLGNDSTLTVGGNINAQVTLNLLADTDADTLNIVLDDSDGDDNIVMGSSIVADDAETVNVTSLGLDEDPTNPMSNDLLFSSIDMTDMIIDGDYALTVSTTTGASALTNVDASAATGNIDLTKVVFDETAGNTNTITTGSGNDIINASKVVDTITGGAGDDEFIFDDKADSGSGSVDTITDFVSGSDTLTIGDGTNSTVKFVGNQNGFAAAESALSGGDNSDMEAVYDTATSQVYIDVDGNGTIDSEDMVIQLVGVDSLTAEDFGIVAP